MRRLGPSHCSVGATPGPSLLSKKKIQIRSAAGPGLLALVLASAPALPAEAPATVALVLDTSGSLTGDDLARARELATGVLQALPSGSEVAVFSFDDQARLVQPRTPDAEAVRRAVDALRSAGRFTALHDALYDASRYLREATGARRAILLMTDGRDENSALSLEDGLKLAQETLIPVFCVGVGRVEERVLRRIAKLTGGEYYPSPQAAAPVLAEGILAAPEVRPPPSAPAVAVAPAGAPGAAVSPTPTDRAGPAPGPFYRSPLLWAGLGLLLLLAAGAVALAGRAPRATRLSAGGPTRLDTAREEALERTVLARVDEAGEALERTVLMLDEPVLAATRGARKGETFRLSAQSAISIGRSRANDIVIDDASVSSQHCRIRPEQGRFVVHDLNSTNGTMVNGRRVERHVLDEGDVVQVGETSLQFRRERK